MLLLFLSKEILTEFSFGTGVKNDAINIMNGSNLADKRGVLSIFLIIYKK